MTAEPGQAWNGVDQDGMPTLALTSDLRRLIAYWQQKRGTRRFPTRADLDPVDLPFMLERISLIEVHWQPALRYRLRLVGSWWVRKYGVEGTGRWLDEWPNPTQLKLTLESYSRLLYLRQPLILRRVEWVDNAMLNYEVALLPLSEDGEQISMILAGIGQN